MPCEGICQLGNTGEWDGRPRPPVPVPLRQCVSVASTRSFSLDLATLPPKQNRRNTSTGSQSVSLAHADVSSAVAAAAVLRHRQNLLSPPPRPPHTT